MNKTGRVLIYRNKEAIKAADLKKRYKEDKEKQEKLRLEDCASAYQTLDAMQRRVIIS